MFLVLWLMLSAGAAQANVLGDFQTFAPNTDGLDFVTVHSSRPLTQRYFSFGGHFSYAKDHFLVYRDMQTQEKLKYKDSLGEFDFDFAYGLTKRLSLTFAATNLIYYEPEPNQEFKAEASIGTHTYRPGFKWTLGSKATSLAFLFSVDIPNVENSPFGGVVSKPIYNLELAKTFRGSSKGIFYGVNLGYRVRDPGETPVDARMFPLDDQYLFSVARSAPMTEKSRWILEAIASGPAQKAPYKDAMDASSLDLLLGIKHRITKNLNLDYGVTFEPFVDSMSPAYRAFAGMVYYFNMKPSTPAPPPPQMPEEEQVIQIAP
jgi:OmpA-OmpF porin, OOP family